MVIIKRTEFSGYVDVVTSVLPEGSQNEWYYEVTLCVDGKEPRLVEVRTDKQLALDMHEYWESILIYLFAK